MIESKNIDVLVYVRGPGCLVLQILFVFHLDERPFWSSLLHRLPGHFCLPSVPLAFVKILILRGNIVGIRLALGLDGRHHRINWACK